MRDKPRVTIFKDFGHPWSRESGWDMMRVKVSCCEDMNEFIDLAEQKHWRVWISDDEKVWLFQPSGASSKWIEDY